MKGTVATTCMVAEQRAPIHGISNIMEKDPVTRGIASWDGAEETVDTFEVERYHYRDRKDKSSDKTNEKSHEKSYGKDGRAMTVRRGEDKDRDVKTATKPGADSGGAGPLSSTSLGCVSDDRVITRGAGRGSVASCKLQVQESIFTTLVRFVDSDDDINEIKELQGRLSKRLAGIFARGGNVSRLRHQVSVRAARRRRQAGMSQYAKTVEWMSA